MIFFFLWTHYKHLFYVCKRPDSYYVQLLKINQTNIFYYFCCCSYYVLIYILFIYFHFQFHPGYLFSFYSVIYLRLLILEGFFVCLFFYLFLFLVDRVPENVA